ncbi:MAG TPA: DNA repair protein RecO [Fimbriimonas sp.]
MERIVHAIVLRRRDAGESDRRLTILSEEMGKLDVVAKGARKAASRLAGSSDPLSVAVMNLAEGKLNRFVTQAQPVTSFPGLRSDYDRLQFGLALCELCAAVLPIEQPVPEAYELLLKSLAMLEVHQKPIVALVWAQVHLLSVSGFLPQLDACVVTGEPVAVPEPFVSPRAGGIVSDASSGRYADRFRTRREVLIGIRRLADVEQPPANLRFAEEALATLLPFWQEIAAIPLPANDAVVKDVRHRTVGDAP